MMNVPNFITYLRLVLAVASFFIIMQGFWLLGAVILTFAVLMDVLDGIAARSLKQVTKHGVYLDVMADKIVIIGTFFVVGMYLHIAFFYMGILMLVREYAIDTMRSVAAVKGKVISADKFSKIKGVLFMIGMLGMVWNQVVYGGGGVLEQVFIWTAAVGMTMSYITLVRFSIKYMK